MIEDAAIATMYAIEAVGLFDHYHFNKSANEATTTRPLTLWSPGKSDTPWWKQYYDKTQIQMRDRCLFANVPLPSGMDATKKVDWSALDTESPPPARKKAASAKKSATHKRTATVRKTPAKRKASATRKVAAKRKAVVKAKAKRPAKKKRAPR